MTKEDSKMMTNTKVAFTYDVLSLQEEGSLDREREIRIEDEEPLIAHLESYKVAF